MTEDVEPDFSTGAYAHRFNAEAIAAECLYSVVQRWNHRRDGCAARLQLKTLKVTLKYAGRRGVIEGLRRVSRPGLRNYVGSGKIPRVRGGLGVAVISTPEGIMSGNEARRKNLGGEVVCYVW